MQVWQCIYDRRLGFMRGSHCLAVYYMTVGWPVLCAGLAVFVICLAMYGMHMVKNTADT